MNQMLSLHQNMDMTLDMPDMSHQMHNSLLCTIQMRPVLCSLSVYSLFWLYHWHTWYNYRYQPCSCHKYTMHCLQVGNMPADCPIYWTNHSMNWTLYYRLLMTDTKNCTKSMFLPHRWPGNSLLMQMYMPCVFGYMYPDCMFRQIVPHNPCNYTLV